MANANVMYKVITPVHKVGNHYYKFSPSYGAEVYILATTGGDDVVLISIENGMRWSDIVEVQDRKNISDVEWDLITGGDEFKMIKGLEITVNL